VLEVLIWSIKALDSLSFSVLSAFSVLSVFSAL
jgi:hypothetical protein